MKIKAIFIPGNGGGTMQDNWFPWLKKELEKLEVKVIAKDFPDPILAREKYWLPFLRELGADEDTILIGHSSGAIAAMRFAEHNRILGSILVGTYYTDMGDESEEKSGYFVKPWDWDTIKKNQKWIIQFHSTDDPFIPDSEAHYVHNHLKTEYYEFTDRQHFGHGDHPQTTFPELLEALHKKL